MTATGLLSTPEAVQLLETAVVDLKKHRSTQLTPEMLRKSDIVLGMTPFHVQFALRMSDDARGKTHLFKEFTKSDPKNYQITDPMGHTLEVYKRVFREIRQACEFLVVMEFVTGKAPKAKEKEPARKKAGAAREKRRQSLGQAARRGPTLPNPSRPLPSTSKPGAPFTPKPGSPLTPKSAAAKKAGESSARNR